MINSTEYQNAIANLVFISVAIVIFIISTTTVSAEAKERFSCKFNNSIFVDNSGVYEAPKWSSEGFSIEGEWLILDKGNLKLKITRNIQEPGIQIIRGGEPKKGYQFSLENGSFAYVLLMIPLSKTWTVTGTCK